MQYPKQGDFLIDGKWTAEIGGSSKSKRQIKGIEHGFVAADDIEVGYQIRFRSGCSASSTDKGINYHIYFYNTTPPDPRINPGITPNYQSTSTLLINVDFRISQSKNSAMAQAR